MSSAQTMKIYSIISRIEQELEESPRTKFAGATNKRIVEIDRLFDLLSDLKVTIPEDIRRATGIIAEADNTIRDAKENAQDIVDRAHQEADQILMQAQQSAQNLYQQAQIDFEARVSDAAVYKEAQARAQEITGEAETNANAIYNGARNYADEILCDLQRYMSEYHEMIGANRRELGVSPAPQQPAPVTPPQQAFEEQVVHLEQPAPPPAQPAPQPAYRQPVYEQSAQDAYEEPEAYDEYGAYDDYDEPQPARRPAARPGRAAGRAEPQEEDDYEYEQ